jgi:hypothetical protein
VKMVSAVEGAHAAAEAQVLKENQARLAAAKPERSLLHHIAATTAMQTGFDLLLLDGTSYTVEKDKVEYMFTDGLSFMHSGHKTYIPLTAIKAIVVRNPGDA